MDKLAGSFILFAVLCILGILTARFWDLENPSEPRVIVTQTAPNIESIDLRPIYGEEHPYQIMRRIKIGNETICVYTFLEWGHSATAVPCSCRSFALEKQKLEQHYLMTDQ